MTVLQLREWCDRLIGDKEKSKAQFQVILNPLGFGDRWLNFDDLALRPPAKQHGSNPS